MGEDILILVDDIELRGFFYDILTQLDYTVTTAPSCEGLLDILKKDRPDFIVVDCDAISMEQPVFLSEIRQIEPSVKLILLGSQPGGTDDISHTADTIYVEKDSDTPQLVRAAVKVIRENKVVPRGEKLAFSGKILIVDDEQSVASLVNNYLCRVGYDTDMAFNGEEALLKIQAARPKVVVLDIMMPGMDGLLVLKRIKEIDNSIVVIVTTGLRGEAKILQEALKLGAATYLFKPYNLKQLETFILTSIMK